MTARRSQLKAERGSRPRLLDQPITYRRFGQDVLGLRRIVLEFLPQMSHVNTHVMPILRVCGTPHLAQDLPMSEYFAGIGDEQCQHAVLDGRQMNHGTAFARSSQVQIDFDIAELEYRTRAGGRAGFHRRRAVARTRASSSPTLKGLVK